MEKNIEEVSTNQEQKPEVEPTEEKPKRRLPVGMRKRVQFEDGGFKTYEFEGEIKENVQWRRLCKMLGLDPNGTDAAAYQHDIAAVGKLVFEWLQTDDYDEVYKFVRQLARRTPSSGNRIWNLKKQMEILWKENNE